LKIEESETAALNAE